MPKVVKVKDRIIGVHLDFKGVMFKSAYIPQLLSDLAGQGVNTVLVEYEDVFPFKGLDIAADKSVRWTRAVLAQFLAEAGRNGLEIIPLQQCLGHLEYVFRWRRYRRLAENRAYPSTLCTSNADGKQLIFGMLRQIIEGHPGSRYVHLGMDEAHSLATCPRCRRKGDVLTMFLDYLRKLCDICEEYGRTPIIWSDILEDHFRPEAFDNLKDRVILCSWDYGPHNEVDYSGRLGGQRVSREWLQHPEDMHGPSISTQTKYIEDLPAGIRRVAAKYRRDRGYRPLFLTDLWTKLGFRVIGGSQLRVSTDGAIMPYYNLTRNNVSAWCKAIGRTGQMGVFGTSWARGTTFCPPNFNSDLTWPSITFLARAMGVKGETFWPGVDQRKVDLLIRQLGRCRRDWQLEDKIADEMDALAPRVREHRYEWESLALMARVLRLRRRVDFALLEVDHFDANCRLVELEWKRRLGEQAIVQRDLAALHRKVRRHFSRRYYGHAFEEWIKDLFCRYESRLVQAGVVCRRKLKHARRFYAR